MSPRFFHYLKIVAVVHVLVLGILVLVSGWRRLVRPKPEISIPVEFVVEAPSATDVDVRPAPRPLPPPEKAVPPAPKPKPIEKKPIQRSSKRVTRTVDRPVPAKNALSQDEIRKLLEQGAQLSDHTAVSSEDGLLLDRIRRVLYEAWDQPSKEEAGEGVVRAEVSIGVDGRITGQRLIAPSGTGVLDASVMRALRAVTRIDGVTPEFHRRHPSVTIAFKVE